MPEEKKSFFSDLPEEEKKEDEVTEDKKPEEKEETEKEKELRRLGKASKDEDARIAKMKEDLGKKREERKKLALKAKEDSDDDADEEEEKPEDKIKEVVASEFEQRARREYDERLASEIRKFARNRKEAEETFEMAKKLPPASPELDARFARERIQALKEHSRGFVAPSFSGVGSNDIRPSNTEEIPGVSPERLKTLMDNGWTKDQILKYKDGMDFARIFPKVIKNNR